ncbi:MAG: GNAT family N-acetyltransferase [Planctomycetes bacterium]|nr:GNAT family N-acetyltransferase [Planctomycetota bacterium]
MENEEKSQYHVEGYQTPYSEELKKEFTRFYYGLNHEMELFTLTQEQILSAKHIYALYHEDHIVGIAGIRGYWFCGIFFMVVQQKYQGKGLGRKLMDTLLDELPKSKILMLTVLRGNIKARRLYKTMNFKRLLSYKSTATMLYRNPIGRLLQYPIAAAVLVKSVFFG